MVNILKIELGKAFINKFFLFTIITGIVFALMSAFYSVGIYYSDFGFLDQVRIAEEMGHVKYKIVESATLFNSWIGGESNSLGYTLFFTLFPLLAVLPYGYSFSEELREGYLKIYVPLCGRKKYFVSKIAASFLSGGTAIVIPLIFSLLVTALFIPAIKPNVVYDLYFPIMHGGLFSEIVYTYPLLFTAIYLCIDFIFAGLFANMSISVVMLFKGRFAPLILPFIFLLFCDMLRNLLLYISYVEISPLLILHAMPVLNTVKAPIMLGWFLIFFLLTVPFIIYKGSKYEIF